MITEEELEKEAEERTEQYMNEHTEKYNCECTKLETDNYNVGREYGYSDGYIDGVKSREKIIKELEKKVGKLEFSLENKIVDYEKLEKENEMFKKANEIIAQQRDDRDADISKLEERNVELIDEVMELKSQIEKMKCCGNCTKGNCVNIGKTGKACGYWTSNKLREIKE